MDRINQYNKLSNIKPGYKKLKLPFYSVSKIKIIFNQIEFKNSIPIITGAGKKNKIQITELIL